MKEKIKNKYQHFIIKMKSNLPKDTSPSLILKNIQKLSENRKHLENIPDKNGQKQAEKAKESKNQNHYKKSNRQTPNSKSENKNSLVSKSEPPKEKSKKNFFLNFAGQSKRSRELQFLLNYSSPCERSSDLKSTILSPPSLIESNLQKFSEKFKAFLSKFISILSDFEFGDKLEIFSRTLTILYDLLFQLREREMQEVELLIIGFTCLWISLKYHRAGLYLSSLRGLLGHFIQHKLPISKHDLLKWEWEILIKIRFKISFRSHFQKLDCLFHHIFSWELDFAQKESKTTKHPQSPLNLKRVKEHSLQSKSCEELPIKSTAPTKETCFESARKVPTNRGEKMKMKKDLSELKTNLMEFADFQKELKAWTEYWFQVLYLEPSVVLRFGHLVHLICLQLALDTCHLNAIGDPDGKLYWFFKARKHCKFALKVEQNRQKCSIFSFEFQSRFFKFVWGRYRSIVGKVARFKFFEKTIEEVVKKLRLSHVNFLKRELQDE